METKQNKTKQISSNKGEKKDFLQRNFIGVIAFCLFIFYDLLRSGNLFSVIIDIPLALLIAALIQLIFNGLKKIFEK